MREETLLVHAGRHISDDYDFVNPPVIRASTVLHKSAEDMMNRAMHERAMIEDKIPYGTYGTPTHHAFYKALCALEGKNAAGAWAFPSGLAACTIPLLAFLKAGDHALLIDTIYGPTREFAEEVLRRMGVEVEFFSPSVGADIASLFKANTALVMLETPGSHTFEMPDVPAIAKACQEKGVISVIDNTWATPLFFKPLDVGVDVVIHAATKYIGGHSDLTMGVVICNAKTWPQAYRTFAQTGQTTGCDDIYLAYRGLHSMAVRVKAAAQSTKQIIDWLLQREEVERVLWPALPTDPSYPIWKRDFSGATSLFGVVFKERYANKLAPMIDALKIFGRGYSWGGFESLLIQSYGTRNQTPMPFERMVRIAVGLENPVDLIEDLNQAFNQLPH